VRRPVRGYVRGGNDLADLGGEAAPLASL
jgi:hypothetical protein